MNNNDNNNDSDRLLGSNPLTFSADANRLMLKLTEEGTQAVMMMLLVDRAPVWSGGNIVNHATGWFAGARVRYNKLYADHVILLTDGSVSFLPDSEVIEERPCERADFRQDAADEQILRAEAYLRAELKESKASGRVNVREAFNLLMRAATRTFNHLEENSDRHKLLVERAHARAKRAASYARRHP